MTAIRHEEQSSWETSTTGHAKGDATVIDLFGEEYGRVRCKRGVLDCNGIKTCELFDKSLLDGFEGYERDDAENERFWKAELDENEREFSDPDGPLSRFYRRAMESKCKIPCNGKVIICDYKTTGFNGKKTFIGCDGWRKGDVKVHRYFPIPWEVDEVQVAEMLRNDGKISRERDTPVKSCGDKCSVILHFSSKKETCSFSHVVEGKVKCAKIVKYSPGCSSRLIIFEPVDQKIRKVIVIPVNSHNHPRRPHTKPTYAEKEIIQKASKASGQIAIAPKALRQSATTSALLNGKSWESQVPGLVDNKKLRKLLKKNNDEEYPCGLDWKGVQHEVDERESKLPPEQRYIHTITTKGEFRLIVTMHPRIVKYIHDARFLVLDYTFKRIQGEMNEWEVSGMIDRFKCRVTYASLYCNKATREAFNFIFDEFFDTVKRVTKKDLRFALLHGEGKMLVVLFDAEVAQMQAFGDKLRRMNDSEVSKITTKDPLVIVQHFTKTCNIHFLRNIDKLPNNIPRSVTNTLKSFITLENEQDIAQWHNFCKTSPYKEVITWYKQKLENPWYLPSLNAFLSLIPKDHWKSTPSDSNIGESAHAGRNAETGINRPLLGGILDARRRDNEMADTLDAFENSLFATTARFNLPYEREKRAEARRAANFEKSQAVDKARSAYISWEEKLEELTARHQRSMLRTHEISDRLKMISNELKSCSKVSMLAKDLSNEKAQLKQEERALIDRRKEWALEKARIKETLKSMKENELKNVRTHDQRQKNSPSPIPIPQNPSSPVPSSPMTRSSSPLPVPRTSSPVPSSPVPSSPGRVTGDQLVHADESLSNEDWWVQNESFLQDIDAVARLDQYIQDHGISTPDFLLDW